MEDRSTWIYSSTQTIDGAGTRVYTYNSAGQVLTEGYTAGIMEDLGITNVYDGQLRRQSLGKKRGRESILKDGSDIFHAWRIGCALLGSVNVATIRI